MAAKRRSSRSKKTAAADAIIETDRMLLLCGRIIERRRVGLPGAFQLYRPMGDECEGCQQEGVTYMREAITGKMRGPVCLVKGLTSEEESSAGRGGR